MTNKALLFFLLLFLACQSAFSQRAYLKGRIAVQNSKTNTGKRIYLDNATIEAESANPARSFDGGNFTLSYFNKSAGEQTQLRITYPEMEVVNIDALNTIIPSDTSLRKHIYLSKRGELASMILKLRGVAEREITKKYEDKISTLQLELTNQANSQLELEEERDEAIRHFKDLAKKLARINLDDANDAVQQAYQLFEKGDIEMADKKMEAIDIGNTVHELTDKIKLGEKLTREAKADLQDFFATVVPLKMGIKYSKLDFKSVDKIYEDILINSDTLNIDFNIEAALYYLSQSKPGKAFPILLKTASLCKDDLKKQAYLNYLLSSTAFTSSQVDKMLLYGRASCDQYGKLARLDPDKYTPILAILKVWLGVAEGFSKNMEASEAATNEGVALMEQLCQKDSLKYEPMLAWAMSAHMTNFDLERSTKVESMFRKLSVREPEVYEPYLAFVLFQKALALMYGADGGVSRKKELETCMQEAFALAKSQFSKIKATTPKVNVLIAAPDSLMPFREILGNSDSRTNIILSTMGLMSSISLWIFNTPDPESHLWQSSKQTLELAVKKSRELANDNPDRFIGNYAEFVTILGLIDLREQHFEEAFKKLELGYQALVAPYQDEPQAYGLIMATNRVYYYTGQATYYGAKDAFYGGMDKDSMELLYQFCVEQLKNYPNVPMLDQQITLMDEWHECLQRKTSRETILLRAFQETRILRSVALERKDNEDYNRNVEMGIKFLDRLYEDYKLPDDGILLLTEYNNWLDRLDPKSEPFYVYSVKRVELQEQLLLQIYDPTLVSSLAANCGNLSWNRILVGEYKTAIDFAKMGMDYDPDQTWIMTNLALATFLTGDEDGGIRLYAEFANKPYQIDSSKLFKDFFLADIDVLLAGNPKNKELVSLRKKIARDKYPKGIAEQISRVNAANAIFDEAVELASTDGEGATQKIVEATEEFKSIVSEAWFAQSFKPDIQVVFSKLALCNLLQDKEMTDVAEFPFPELVFEVIDHENTALEKILRQYPTLDYSIFAIKYYVLVSMDKYIIAYNPGNDHFKTILLKLYGNLATTLVLSQSYSDALDSAKEGLELSPENGWLYSIMALAHACAGDTDDAIAIYREWKDKAYFNSDFETYKDRFAFDLKKVKGLEIEVPEYEQLMKLLE
ncbi:MAG: hypothetical protein H6576_13635 [Lewinellaceae bacterium]|nr:hypothetical protein [Lewinellaceae bacterium]